MRRIASAAALLTLLACRSMEPSFTIPTGYQPYRFDPTLLNYSFIDTTSGVDLRFSWVADTRFTGLNCIALSPRTSPDTTGQFVFVRAGPNQGIMAQVDHGQLDSIVASFFGPVAMGTHGTYAVTSAGRLNLFWLDGTQYRYFDPTAVIRLSGDTIASDVDIKTDGDSVRVQWHVRWLRDPC